MGTKGTVPIGMFNYEIYRGLIELKGKWYTEIYPDDMDSGFL